MTLTIGKYITISYQPAVLVDLEMQLCGGKVEQEIPEDEIGFYIACGFKVTMPYWHMTLREPDGTVNRFWIDKDLGNLLKIARGGSSLFARR